MSLTETTLELLNNNKDLKKACSSSQYNDFNRISIITPRIFNLIPLANADITTTVQYVMLMAKCKHDPKVPLGVALNRSGLSESRFNRKMSIMDLDDLNEMVRATTIAFNTEEIESLFLGDDAEKDQAKLYLAHCYWTGRLITRQQYMELKIDPMHCQARFTNHFQ